ncbi:universal stress protein [Halorientalis salina]|uniref:universal stress protein n=1 Tax=Halorientalis salina TaxID=2932266 RepID=UPI0010AC0FC6|nr:universal stress protein [Halorientalis salina]
MYETILVPTDGSDVAAGALDHAIDAAQRHDATIHLLYVVDMRVARTAPGLALGDLRDALEDEGEDALDDLAATVADAGLDVVTTIRQGVPDSEILDYVEEIDADFLVMGSSGKSQRERIRVGSVTESLVRAATVPVVSVPDP